MVSGRSRCSVCETGSDLVAGQKVRDNFEEARRRMDQSREVTQQWRSVRLAFTCDSKSSLFEGQRGIINHENAVWSITRPQSTMLVYGGILLHSSTSVKTMRNGEHKDHETC